MPLGNDIMRLENMDKNEKNSAHTISLTLKFTTTIIKLTHPYKILNISMKLMNSWTEPAALM